MPKISTVEKSRKPHTCGKCGDIIPAGSTYRFVKPRYGNEKIRCMKHECRFRPTDLSTSKAVRIEEAIEDASESIYTAEDHDSIQMILSDVVSVAEEVAEEYRDASSAWAGGSNAEFEEKADACESFAQEIGGWSYSDETEEETIREGVREAEDGPGQGEDEESFAERIKALEDEAWEQALQDMRDEAASLMDGFWL